MAVPTDAVVIKSLGTGAGQVTAVSLLGSPVGLTWKQEAGALRIQPVKEWPCQHAVVFKIDFKS